MKLKKLDFDKYVIYDEVGYPFGTVENKNFKTVFKFNIAISKDKLIELLNELNKQTTMYIYDIVFE
jgi:hypothetical protein